MRVNNFERLDGDCSLEISTCFLVLCMKCCFGIGEFIETSHHSGAVASPSAKGERIIGKAKVFLMLGTRAVVDFEGEIELDVYEAESIELLVSWRMKVNDDYTKVGKCALNEMVESINTIARFRCSKSSSEGRHV